MDLQLNKTGSCGDTQGPNNRHSLGVFLQCLLIKLRLFQKADWTKSGETFAHARGELKQRFQGSIGRPTLGLLRRLADSVSLRWLCPPDWRSFCKNACFWRIFNLNQALKRQLSRKFKIGSEAVRHGLRTNEKRSDLVTPICLKMKKSRRVSPPQQCCQSGL